MAALQEAAGSVVDLDGGPGSRPFGGMTPPDPSDLRSALASAALFRKLPGEVLDQVGSRCLVRRIPARGTLFRKGEQCEGLWVVVRGRVRVYRSNRDGREQVIHEFGAGRSLAEVPLFDGGPYPAHARAEEDSTLLFLPRSAFQELYRTNPMFADAVIGELGRRLRGAVRLIERISLRDVPSRVGLALLEFGQSGGGDPTRPFRVPRTQAELAESLAATRESVARALRTLREEGLIEQSGARVRIPDPDALESRCWGM
jgi:CRP/FNR family transcriptional regulator, dissimilatory nitrate respiration regulator